MVCVFEHTGQLEGVLSMNIRDLSTFRVFFILFFFINASNGLIFSRDDAAQIFSLVGSAMAI